LKKAQRLNVAISRAKQLLVVVGDIETMTGREGQDLYRPLLEHIEREGRVAGIGALHAMDAAAGGRRRGDRRRQRGASIPPGRSRRRRRGFTPRPVTPGAPAASNGTEGTESPVPDNGVVPPRKFRRRRGRRRGGFSGANGTQSGAPADAGSSAPSGEPPERQPAARVAAEPGN
jgi:hypothetical protein